MALMIISLISLLGLRVVYNNEVNRALKIDKSDLYKTRINNIGDMEDIITEVNIYSARNKDIINKLKESGIKENIIGKVVSLQYLKDKDMFYLVYNKVQRYDLNLRYKVVEGSVYFLPEKNYVIL